MKKLIIWLKGLLPKLRKLREKYIPIAVNVVQGVKRAIESGTLDTAFNVLRMFLPDIGDVILDQVEKYLINHIPELCVQLEIIEAVQLSDKSEEAIKQCLEALKETYGDKWAEFMSGMSGDLANFLSDGVLDAKESRVLAGKFYDKYIKKQ